MAQSNIDLCLSEAWIFKNVSFWDAITVCTIDLDVKGGVEAVSVIESDGAVMHHPALRLNVHTPAIRHTG